jgi:LDH2 family malate/lactate/ureidoglycolate dehydrogenase
VTSATEPLTAERVRDFTARVLERVGMTSEDARIVGDALAWADLRGLTAQGIAKLPLIVQRIRAGGTRADATIELVADSPSFARVDAHGAWGHVAGVRAMRIAMANAKATGVAAVTVGNTDSASALGYYVELAAREGLIGLAINDGTPLMPPPGGTTRVVGNQAFAIAAPSTGDPLLFDSALSGISWTQIDELRDRGEPLRQGLALDASGHPTTDHAAAIAGLLLPMGGHRGFGLALMWEVLTGVLSGNERFASRVTPLADLASPQSVGHFYLAVEPARAVTLAEFTARVDALVTQVHASPPAEGVARVFVPGEQGYAAAARRAREGITVPRERASELAALGDEVGVRWE